MNENGRRGMTQPLLIFIGVELLYLKKCNKYISQYLQKK